MHVPAPSRTLYDLPIVADATWQMSYGERFALEGLLSHLQPGLAIETGTAQGGTMRRIAAHAEEVHCFDLVDSVADVVAQVPNAHAHIGDSAKTLPDALAAFAAEGRHVDFALIDGDHTFDGVQRDTRAVLASDACRRTIVVFHDTANEEVRAGLDALDLPNHPKVELCMLDFVPGYLVVAGHVLEGEAWNGLGLMVLNDEAAPGQAIVDEDHYSVPEMYALARARLDVRSTEFANRTGDALRDLRPIDPARFPPPPPAAAIAEADEVARAWWATLLAEGREVLVLASTHAQPLNLIADHGARAVVAAAANDTIADTVRADANPSVEVVTATPERLPFDDRRFGLVLWLETDIEHVRGDGALDEIARVTADDGLVVVSVPNLDGAPADALEGPLSRHFEHVELRRQQAWVASLIADTTTNASTGFEPLSDPRLATIAGEEPGSEMHTIGLASRSVLPSVPPLAVTGPTADVHEWSRRFEEQQRTLVEQHERLTGIATRTRELHLLRRELREAESALAGLPEVSTELFGAKRDIELLQIELEKERARSRAAEQEARQDLEAQLERSRRVMEEMKRSPSWRITAPLRKAKRLLRG